MKRKIMSIVLCIFMVLSVMPISAIAAELGHSHCICGEADCTKHGGEHTWEPLPEDGVPTTPGTYYYYLPEDRTQELFVDSGVTLNFCLNGHTLSNNDHTIMVNHQGEVNLCDCSGSDTGKTYTKTYAAGVFAIEGTVNLYSGTCTVFLCGSNFHMYGGKLSGSTDCLGLWAYYGSNIVISGGEITDNQWERGNSSSIAIGASTASISNIKIKNTYKGLYARTSNITFSNVEFENNGATGSLRTNFNIINSDVVMNNCTIKNSVGYGIILDGGNAIFNNCTITGSSLDNVYLKQRAELTVNGGEISNSNKGINIENSKVELNGGVIKGNGSGVSLAGGSFKMSGSEISNNQGLGVTVNSGKFEMRSGKISGNASCGVWMSGGSFAMSDGEISNNSDSGVHVNRNTIFEMSGGKISGNRTTKKGGGVYVYEGRFIMTGGEISDNYATQCGGGICSEKSSVVIRNGLISHNSTDDAGGGYFHSGGREYPTEINGATICDNTAELGGGMFLWDGTQTISNTEISGNTATQNGGGLYLQQVENIEISGGEISGNTAKNGGGIYSDIELNSGKIANCEICGNTATGNGGAIYATRIGNIALNGNTRISNNTATNGGALYFDSTIHKPFSANYMIDLISLNDQAVISGNTATGNGGGIYSLKDNSIYLNGGNISGNTAGALGGGIYFGGADLNVSGSAKVGGNLANGVADDIYLPDGKKIKVIGELDNASVGIRMENPDTFTNNYSAVCGTADPASFFVSNDKQKTVAFTQDNAEATLIDGHTHDNWSYTANGATLTATCGSDSYSETLTISAESEYFYDGTAKVASLSKQGGMISDLRSALISYNTEDGKAPTVPGEYTASITVGGATASVSFEITIDGVDAPSPTQTEYFYTGEAQSYFNIPEDALYTATNNTQTAVGEYIVTLSLNDKEHLVWSDSGNTDDKVYNFVIKKQIVQEPSAPTSEIVYNGAPQSYFSNIDTSLYTATGNTKTYAGSYTVTLTLRDKANCVWSSNGSNADLKFTFVIAKAPLSIAVKDQTVQFNGSISSTLNDVTLNNPAQLMGGDALSGVTLMGDTSTATNIGHISLGAVIIKNGEIDVTDNYKVESTNGNLTVLPEDLPSVKTLTGIIVTKAPDKTAYNVGNSFNPTGMVVTATYSVVSGDQTFTTSDIITTYTVTDGNNLSTGKAFVTISYTENGVTKETTQAIHIHGNAALVSKTPATCTADGEMAHYLCSCGVRFLDENCTQPVGSDEELAIKKAPHTDEDKDGKCDNCQSDISDKETQKSFWDKLREFINSIIRAIVEFFKKIGVFFGNLFK